jgi:acyl carrier protein
VTEKIQADLSGFISQELVDPDDPAPIAPDMALLDGFLDSFGLMVLINHLEEHYGISIANDEMIPENFGTIEALARFVEGKMGAAA